MSITFQLQSSDWNQALNRLLPIIDKKNPMPIFSHILLTHDAQNACWRMYATDGDVLASCDVPVHMRETHAPIAMPAKKAFDVGRMLSKVDVMQGSLDAQRMTLKNPQHRFTIGLMDGGLFPDYALFNPEYCITSPAFMLKKMMHQTAYAIAECDVRHYLNGLCINIDSQSLTMSSTDGYRLAIAKVRLPEPSSFEARVIVPKKSIMDLMKYGLDSPVQWGTDGRFFVFKQAGFHYQARCIEGHFPFLPKLIPQQADLECHISKEAFMTALQGVSILTEERKRHIDFHLGHGHMSVTLINSAQEEARSDIAMDYEGPDVLISFNVMYWLDVLGVCVSPLLKVGWGFKHKGTCIRDTDDLYHIEQTHVIMPFEP